MKPLPLIESGSPFLSLSLFVGAAISLSGCGWIDEAAKEDTKIVILSPGPATSITIDGGAAVELSAGKFQSFAVGPGAHEVVFDGGRKVSVTLEAFDRWVVPAVDDQCFFSIDVASSHYSADGKKALGGPDIGKRLQESAAFKFPRDHYLTAKELPSEVSSGTLLYLLRSLPCEEIDKLQAGLGGKPAAAQRPSDPIVARLGDFRTAIGCDDPKGMAAAFCVAAGAWTHVDTKAKLGLPEAGKSYVGARVDIPASGELGDVLASAKLSLLALRPEGDAGVASLNGVNPESDEEKAELDAALAGVNAVFAGETNSVALGDGLAGYVDSMPASAKTPLTATEHGLSLGEGVELRAAGPLVVAVEHSGDGNLTLSFHVPR